MMTCPNCGSRRIGEIGYNQFFCSDCFKEYKVFKRKVEIYNINDDGTIEIESVKKYEDIN